MEEKELPPENQKPSGSKEKFRAFIEKNKGIWQLIKFAFVSMLTAVIEIVTFAVLLMTLRNVNTPINWFIFNYEAIEGGGGGLGQLIAFLSSITIAQVLAFIINRKKTFKANNNLAFSITAYIIMVAVLIIGLQIYTAPLMVDAIDKALDNLTVTEFLVKVIQMLSTFVITFLCNKFIIMREK